MVMRGFFTVLAALPAALFFSLAIYEGVLIYIKT
jgi:hypothetical protein